MNIKYLKLPYQFDPVRLQHDLSKITQADWIDHFVTRNYSGSWQAIGLTIQASAQNMHPIMSIFSNPAEDTWIASPYLEQSPYFQEVLAIFKCPLQSVRLMCLAPGSEIKQHTDHLTAYEDGHIRLHIPIQTNSEVKFSLQEQLISMSEGECWYLNFNLPHSVVNQGTSSRIHIVMDLKVNDWVAEVFRLALK